MEDMSLSRARLLQLALHVPEKHVDDVIQYLRRIEAEENHESDDNRLDASQSHRDSLGDFKESHDRGGSTAVPVVWPAAVAVAGDSLVGHKPFLPLEIGFRDSKESNSRRTRPDWSPGSRRGGSASTLRSKEISGYSSRGRGRSVLDALVAGSPQRLWRVRACPIFGSRKAQLVHEGFLLCICLWFLFLYMQGEHTTTSLHLKELMRAIGLPDRAGRWVWVLAHAAYHIPFSFCAMVQIVFGRRILRSRVVQILMKDTLLDDMARASIETMTRRDALFSYIAPVYMVVVLCSAAWLWGAPVKSLVIWVFPAFIGWFHCFRGIAVMRFVAKCSLLRVDEFMRLLSVESPFGGYGFDTGIAWLRVKQAHQEMDQSLKKVWSLTIPILGLLVLGLCYLGVLSLLEVLQQLEGGRFLLATFHGHWVAFTFSVYLMLVLPVADVSTKCRGMNPSGYSVRCLASEFAAIPMPIEARVEYLTFIQQIDRMPTGVQLPLLGLVDSDFVSRTIVVFVVAVVLVVFLGSCSTSSH